MILQTYNSNLYALGSNGIVALYDDIDSYTIIDSISQEITASCEFNSKIYLGTMGGQIYSFDGTSITYCNEVENRTQFMAVADSIIYIMNQTQDLYTYDGITLTKLNTLIGQTATCMVCNDDYLYIGTQSGLILKYIDDTFWEYADAGVAITCITSI